MHFFIRLMLLLIIWNTPQAFSAEKHLWPKHPDHNINDRDAAGTTP